MRKTLLILSLILIVVAVPALVLGCGSDKSTTIETPQGNLNIGGDDAPSEAQLGIAIYPGAQYVQGSSLGFSQDTSGYGTLGGMWVTGDSFDKVVNFYNGKLGTAITSDDAQQGRIAYWMKNAGNSISSVTATENSPTNGKVGITIVVGIGTGETPGP